MLQLLTKRLSSDALIFTGLILFCLTLRIGVVAVRFDELLEDPDSYIGIAQNVAAGRGYSIPNSTRPTAFRPPLYPLLISLIAEDHFAWARACLNLVAATGSLIFIWWTAKNLAFSKLSQVISVLVYGCDPLLLRYSSLSMTESVCSLMAALLLWRLTSVQRVQALGQRGWKSHFLIGIVFGLCVLTRPTFWAFGILYASIIFLSWIRRQESMLCPSVRQFVFALVGLSLVAGPWLIRNMAVLGSPVLMTTHGGYTILLGNNAAFYTEVVEQPLGTVWDGSKGPGQAIWADGVNQQMDVLGLKTEVDRDHWMGNLAKQTIREQPVIFLKACLLRFIRFWNITPSGPAAENISPALLKLVGGYYSVICLMLCVGLWRVVRSQSLFNSSWTPILFLVLSFTMVHLVYWSNVRMRAPVVPAIALIAGAALGVRPSGESACSKKIKS